MIETKLSRNLFITTVGRIPKPTIDVDFKLSTSKPKHVI